MKKLTKSLLAAGVMVAATSASAFVDDICPVVGVDYQHVWMGQYKHALGLGNNSDVTVLPKSYPGASAYIGTRFCDYLGLELGFDWSAKKSKDTTYVEGADNLKTHFNVRRRGGHLDFVGYMPVAECFELMGTVGVGYVQAKVNATFTNTAVGGLSRTGATTFKNAVGRIRVGGNYMFTDCIGARALLGWESTSNLKGRLRVNDFYNENVRPFKDSLTASVGLFFKF